MGRVEPEVGRVKGGVVKPEHELETEQPVVGRVEPEVGRV